MTNANKTPSPPIGGTWTLAVAKARLSEVVDRAQAGPQTITRNGKPSAVIVSAEEWARQGDLLASTRSWTRRARRRRSWDGVLCGELHAR